MNQRKPSYAGQYVALNQAGKVIATGKNSAKVARKARKLGMAVPVIVYVPQQAGSIW